MTTPTLTMPPGRSMAQRLAALQRANDVRVRRAALKRDIASGRRDALMVIAEPPEWAATMKIVDLLLAIPKVGRVKAHGALRRCDISPAKTLGGLSPRQRVALLVEMGRRSG